MIIKHLFIAQCDCYFCVKLFSFVGTRALQFRVLVINFNIKSGILNVKNRKCCQRRNLYCPLLKANVIQNKVVYALLCEVEEIVLS